MTDPHTRERPVAGDATGMGWGSDVAAEMLRRLGIEYVALNPGASFRGLHDSLVNYLGNRDPQLLLCLHEDHAVAIAHGYAKVSDRAMGVALHANVGLMHALLGIYNAWCDRAPMLVIGANGPVDARLRRPWIDWIHTTKDQGALLRGSVKWDDEPRSPEALVETMLRADTMMREAPRGPVYVCLDVGLQEAPLAAPVPLPKVERFAPAAPAVASAKIVAQVADLLVGAKRPVIFAGRSSRSQASWDARVRLAELVGARVATDLKSAAAFPTRHELHLPGLTLRISPEAIAAARAADVVLLLDWIDPAGLFAAVGGEIAATVVNCTLEPYVHHGASMEHFGLAPADIPVRADPEIFAAQVLAAVEQRLGGKARWERGVRAAASVPSGAPTRPADGPIAAADIGLALSAARAGRALTLARVPIAWDGDSYAFTGPLDFLGYDGGGGLSSGPGNTVGAALALMGSERVVAGVLGDGDFLQGATALWTAARYGIPALFVISNNRSNLTDVAHQETMARVRGRPIENRGIGQHIDDPPVDLCALARAQGVEATGPVEKLGDLAPALERALAAVEAGRPHLVDVVVQRT
jgi:thiamine pyrophosphate-dependent acetolactate synthase large subunit-like protein